MEGRSAGDARGALAPGHAGIEGGTQHGKGMKRQGGNKGRDGVLESAFMSSAGSVKGSGEQQPAKATGAERRPLDAWVPAQLLLLLLPSAACRPGRGDLESSLLLGCHRLAILASWRLLLLLLANHPRLAEPAVDQHARRNCGANPQRRAQQAAAR